ncbi:zinc finger, RING/FYVE/PHD-type [Artemisia annua]|uniref:Zinc finger, RING/FYVE/PHD-type n=1 Tax=Artemisia annua TaxID=35608 RepID=A0A2U1MYM3_ARTAN|nr:zinc finger, RING/FYVE/PHD-type [Artemisia annua]
MESVPKFSNRGWVGANGKSVRGVVVINHDKNKNININMLKMSKKDLVKDQQHICPICFDAWTSDGHHRICCLPCGHIYGLSCIRRWLQQKGQRSSQKCPQCNESCTMKNVKLLYATQLHDAVAAADHKISTTRFPFTNKGSRAFELYVSRQQTDALKRRDDALKLLADVRGRRIDLLKRRDDMLDSHADALRQWDTALDSQANALECQAEALGWRAEALEWRAEALEKRAEALGRRVNAFKASLDFFEQSYKEHMDKLDHHSSQLRYAQPSLVRLHCHSLLGPVHILSVPTGLSEDGVKLTYTDLFWFTKNYIELKSFNGWLS